MKPVTAAKPADVAVGGTGFVGERVADAQRATGARSDEPLEHQGEQGETEQANGEVSEVPVADHERVREQPGGAEEEQPFDEQEKCRKAKAAN